MLTRHLICDSLRREGYRVVEASTAAEANAVLRTVPVDLVFVDVHMPGDGDGLGVARFAREQQPKARILITSGKVPPAAIPDLEGLGPYIAKPYLISRVLGLVRQSLGET